MKNVLLAASTLTALSIVVPAWAQQQPAPSPGGAVGPDMLCSEIIEGGPAVARNAANYFGGIPAGMQTSNAAAGQPNNQVSAAQMAPGSGGDPTQQAGQSSGPAPSEPQGSGGSNAGGSSAETATDAAPASDGTILTGAGNFAPRDDAAQSGSNSQVGAEIAAEAGVATVSLTPEQLLTACEASPSARVASVLPEGVPAGATSASGTNSLQSSGGAPGATDTGTTSGTAGAPAAPTAPAEGTPPVETD